MVVTNSNVNYNSAYKRLFDDAKEALKDLGITVSDFTCLEEYYQHIGDLAEAHHDKVSEALSETTPQNANARLKQYSKFLLVPLDEERFIINANSRMITIPTNFSRYGISLNGDNKAETLIFEIDRYFDFMDLVNTDIYMQWVTPTGVQGDKRVTLVDYDDEKITFGWPITSTIADGYGELQVAVKFLVTTPSGSVSYSLNTLPIKLMVKPTLRVELGTTLDTDNTFDFIQNGANSNATHFPASPMISFDLSGNKAYLASDTLTLEVGAYSPSDLGAISYQWTLDGNDISDGLVYDISPWYKKTADTSFVSGKEYYEHKGGTSYELVDNATATFSTNFYEPITRCIIKSGSASITGDYAVSITNTIGSNTSNRISATCTVPAPQDITFSQNLTELNASNVFNDTDKAVLAVSASSDDSHSTETYAWYKKTASTGSFEAISGATGATYEADAAGWYKAIATSTLNRASIIKESAIAKVTEAPMSPTLAYEADGSSVTANGDGIITVTPPATGNITLKVLITDPEDEDDFDIDNPLHTDEIIYEWQHSIKDKITPEWEPVKVNANGVVAVNDNEITVRWTGDQEVFKCKVINKLNTLSAETESGKFNVVRV